MKMREVLRAGAAVLVFGTVACSDAATSSFAPIEVLPGFFPPDPTIEPTIKGLAEVERVEVCKQFVMLNGGTPPMASFSVKEGATEIGTFQLADGGCREAYTANGTAGTFSETPIDGYRTFYQWSSVTGATLGKTLGSSVTLTPTAAEGYLVTFINEEEVREEGCTLTQGYWKTHSKYGPAPYDATWAGMEDSWFYGSGKTWYNLFWTPPAGGNAYIQLAHQYMAAYLNIAAGASTTAEVDAAMADAKAYFSGKSLTTSQIRKLAGTLASYNEGLIGPGHCQD